MAQVVQSSFSKLKALSSILQSEGGKRGREGRRERRRIQRV
jgi:hypothetical protein